MEFNLNENAKKSKLNTNEGKGNVWEGETGACVDAAEQ
jgi:hypothetical protein